MLSIFFALQIHLNLDRILRGRALRELSAWSSSAIDPRQQASRPADSHANLPTRGVYFGTLDPPTAREPRIPIEHPSIHPPPLHPSSPRTSPIAASGRSGAHPAIHDTLTYRTGAETLSPLLRCSAARFPQIDIVRKAPSRLAIATRPTRLFLPAEFQAPERTYGYDCEITIPHPPRPPVIDSISPDDAPCQRTINTGPPLSHRHLEAKHPPRERGKGFGAGRDIHPNVRGDRTSWTKGPRRLRLPRIDRSTPPPSSAPMRAEPGSLQSAAA